jgi:hypothetical protein
LIAVGEGDQLRQLTLTGTFLEEGKGSRRLVLRMNTTTTSAGGQRSFGLKIAQVLSDAEADSIEFQFSSGLVVTLNETAPASMVFEGTRQDVGQVSVTLDAQPDFNPLQSGSVKATLRIAQDGRVLMVSGAFAQASPDKPERYIMRFDISDRLSRTQVNFSMAQPLDGGNVDTLRLSLGSELPTEDSPALVETGPDSRTFEGSIEGFSLVRVVLPADFALDPQKVDAATMTVSLRAEGAGADTVFSGVSFAESGEDTKQFSGFITALSGSGANVRPAGTILVLEEIRNLSGSGSGEFTPMLVEVRGNRADVVGLKGTMMDAEHTFEVRAYTYNGEEHSLLGENPPGVWFKMKDDKYGRENVPDEVKKFIKPFDERLVDAALELKEGRNVGTVLADLKLELVFGTVGEDSVIRPTDWGDIKLVDLAGGEDNQVNIVLKVSGGLKKFEQDNKKFYDTYPIRAFRMPVDISDAPANEPDGKPYDLKRAEDTGILSAPVFFVATNVLIADLVGSPIEMGADTVKEVACMDFAPIGWQSGKKYGEGNLTEELECDVLVEELRRLHKYVSRGVAHPDFADKQKWADIMKNIDPPLPFPVADYDDAAKPGPDDKGGRRWGRPIANAEFAASGGVEKLVISAYPKGKGGDLWKNPGAPGDGADHILFRNPADVFYIAGYGAYTKPQGDELDSCGITDYPGGGAEGVNLMISPSNAGKELLVKANAWCRQPGNTRKVVSLEDAWTKGGKCEVKWLAINMNYRLSPGDPEDGQERPGLRPRNPDYERYERLVSAARMHGVLGFAGAGWSGSSRSAAWVKSDAIWPGYRDAMKFVVDGLAGQTNYPTVIVRVKKDDPSKDWRKESFSGLKDEPSDPSDPAWETRVEVAPADPKVQQHGEF